MNLSDRFKQVRKNTKLTGAEFAKELETHQSVVSSIESGQREQSKNILINLHLKFGVDINWLLTGSTNLQIDEKENLRNQQNSVILLSRAYNIDTARVAIRQRLVNAYADLAWAFILNGDHRAEVAARLANRYSNDASYTYLRYATALLYGGDWPGARDIYDRWSRLQYLNSNKTFKEMFLEELEKLEQLGIESPYNKKAREYLQSIK